MKIFHPSTFMPAVIRRRITPLLAQRNLPLALEKSIVSITFDDCPRSVIDKALMPMQARGWRGTVYISTSLMGKTNHHGLMMDEADVKAVHKAGHEIGGHSYSHLDGARNPIADVISDSARNLEALGALGVKNIRTYAFPYGEVTPEIKIALAGRFEGLRGITPGVMRRRADLNQIRSTPIYNHTGLDEALAQIASLKTSPGWLTLFTHDIRENPSQWGCTPKDFITVLDAVKQSGARVLSVAEALSAIKDLAS